MAARKRAAKRPAKRAAKRAVKRPAKRATKRAAKLSVSWHLHDATSGRFIAATRTEASARSIGQAYADHVRRRVKIERVSSWTL
jgi:hypothetical protein